MYATHKDRYRQHTLASKVHAIGVGLHSGAPVAMVMRPAPADHGIVFVRKDGHGDDAVVPARWYHVTSTTLSTTLGNSAGVTVATVEHLLAALRGCGVDNAVVELDGPEVPIMDGSARVFVDLIQSAGLEAQDAPRYVLWVHSAVTVEHDDKIAGFMPASVGRVTVSIDFDHPVIGAQALSLKSHDDMFAKVADARTFGFEHEIAGLKAQGLARGGSLLNAVVMDDEGVLNAGGLRHRDEFVRHKMLDCIGDLSLAGVPIMGHFFAHKPGHGLNHALLRRLFLEPGAWSHVTAEEYERVWLQSPSRRPDRSAFPGMPPGSPASPLVLGS